MIASIQAKTQIPLSSHYLIQLCDQRYSQSTQINNIAINSNVGVTNQSVPDEVASTLGLSERRVQYIYVVLNLVMQQALNNHYIAFNPCSSVKKPKVRQKGNRQPREDGSISTYKIISDNEYDHIMEGTTSQMFKALYALAWDSGMRDGELLGLTWRNIDFKKGAVRVSQQVSVTKAQGVHITPRLKSQYAYRTLDITPSTMDKLLKHRGYQERHKQPYGLSYQSHFDLVFPKLDGTPKSPADVSSRFKRTIRRLGIDDELSFHSFRHTHATHLAELGVHPKAIQLRLGHATPEFSMKVYVHKTERMEQGIVDLLILRQNRHVVKSSQCTTDNKKIKLRISAKP